MGTEIIPLVIVALQAAIKYVPGLAAEIASLLQKEATPEEWQALKDKYANKTYEQYVPESGLKPTP